MERIKQIYSLNQNAMISAKNRWDSIAKPLGSFGELESLIIRTAGIQESENVDISGRTVVVMCADHGIVEEGVTQTDAEVTAICARSIASGSSNVNVISNQFGGDVLAVDIGMRSDVEHPALLNRKIAYGTRNFTKEPAMTTEQALRAVTVGIDIVQDLKAQGAKLLLTGEMGIGNTTPTSAIASVLLLKSPKEVTGRGAGLSSEGLCRKIKVIEQGIALHTPAADDPIGLLAALGGLEIAGMTGIFLGGAIYRIPVVIDGVISAVSACLAQAVCPECVNFMLASHTSGEPAGEGLLQLLGLHPVIRAGLRLGEGTGALLLIPLLEGALALYNKSHRFDDIAIMRYTEQT